MSTVTENDLRELKDLINSRFSELDGKIDGIDKKLDIHIVRTDEQLKAINNTLPTAQRSCPHKWIKEPINALTKLTNVLMILINALMELTHV